MALFIFVVSDKEDESDPSSACIGLPDSAACVSVRVGQCRRGQFLSYRYGSVTGLLPFCLFSRDSTVFYIMTCSQGHTPGPWNACNTLFLVVDCLS